MRHGRLGIQFRSALERSRGFFVVEAKNQGKSSIKEALRLRTLRRDDVVMSANVGCLDC